MCWVSKRESEKKKFRISRGFSQNFSTLFLFFFFFPIFLTIFAQKVPIFLKKWGGIYKGMRPNGRLARCNMVSHFLTPHQPILYFFFLIFVPIFVQLFGGLFKLLFYSKFICLESYECLVSNGPVLVRFGAKVIKISRLEGRWHSAETFCDVFP